jgi:pimeloyl-ACP methyl ester carboxylesterase
MNIQPNFSSAVILLGFLICSVAASQSQPAEMGEFVAALCPFDLPDGVTEGENFRFGYVTVPELHAHPDGKTIQLAVAIYPSFSENPAPDPLVLNTAGPGKSNMDNFVPQIAAGLGHLILPERDIVLIELRGLRYSRPNLICSEVSDARLSMMQKNLTAEEARAELLEALKAARDRFVNEGVNLSAFNNVETAADIALIMTNLAYKQFNLAGSSAGTLIAQHVIRDYSELVRCAILDAGFPMGSDFLREMVPNGIQTLKRIFKKCEEDPDCSAAYPNLEERVLNLLDSLNEDPVTLPIKHPVTDEDVSYVLNGYRLAEFIFMQMYFSNQIPYLIGKILSGDYSDIAEAAKTPAVTSAFADGLGYSIFLAEAADFSYSDIDIDPAYSVFAKGTTVSGLGGEFILDIQKIWGVKPLDRATIEPQKRSNIPVLVLNGLWDHVIPPKYDVQWKELLDRCYTYRFDGVTHSVVDNAPECALPMVREFLSDPSRAPDSSCVKNYKLKFKTGDE